MTKDPTIYLEHMLESIGLIEEYVSGLDLEKFLDNDEKQDAVLRRISIIGEAAKNLPDEFRWIHEGIPWRRIAGMRDKAIHEYFGVDLQLVWTVTQKNLPELKKAIRSILEDSAR